MTRIAVKKAAPAKPAAAKTPAAKQAVAKKTALAKATGGPTSAAKKTAAKPAAAKKKAPAKKKARKDKPPVDVHTGMPVKPGADPNDPLYMTQQDLLRHAMERLAATRIDFAERFGVTKRALDNWLLPRESEECRPMPLVVRMFVCYVLKVEAPVEKA